MDPSSESKHLLICKGVIHTETSQYGDVWELEDKSYLMVSPDSTSGTTSEKHVVNTNTVRLFESKDLALQTTNRKLGIYVHYKGGIYRKIADKVSWKTSLESTTTLGQGVLYEHLYPHPHAVYWRPQSMFDEPDRFKLIE